DHTCGLKDFPNADIIADGTAIRSTLRSRGWSALRRATLPELIPTEKERSYRGIDHFHDPGFGPFDSTHDVFGDGSVRAVRLPGHAEGQWGLLLQTGKTSRTLLAADSVWTTPTITDNLPPTMAFRMIAANRRSMRKSIQNLQELHRRFPDIRIVPTHCNQIAMMEEFNSHVERHLPGTDPQVHS
ncbi:MAG: hypothetical protein AAFN70_09495, partial [Planctomycetota bacterium]